MTPKATGPSVPGRLMKLKGWLTVPDAARYLTLVFGEDVTEADVLRLGLDGHLRLSVRFVNLAQAKRYVDPAPGFAEAYQEFTAVAAARAAGLPVPVFAAQAPTPLEVECSRVVTLRDEVYDLPLVGGEKLSVEQEYQRQTGGPAITLTALDGTFVDTEDGIRFQLYKEDLTTSDNPTKPGELPYYLEANIEPYRSAKNPASYDHLLRLPSDSVLVVRMTALHAFEAQALDRADVPSDRITKPLDTKERATLLTIIAALAENAGIDVSKPSKASGTIEALTSAKGARVAARTVETYLKLIPDALERKGKASS